MLVSNMGSDEENPCYQDILNEHLLCTWKWLAENQGNSRDLFNESVDYSLFLTDNNMFGTLHF